MATEREEAEVGEELSAVKPKLTIVVILAMLLGILLTVMVAGGFLYYQRSSALQAEVRAARDELKGKSQALAEMKAQIEVLSRQMFALKEYSIAHSTAIGDKDKKMEDAAPTGNAGQKPETLPDAKATAGAPPAAEAPKLKKPKAKPEGQDCELVGKSPEQQAATLQRCVNMMNAPPSREPSRDKSR